MANDNDDWEVAVDTGEFDKRLEQQEKARAANQEPVISSNVNNDDSQNSSAINLMKSNKPIRILKRPTSQSQLSTNNDVTKSLITTPTTITTTTTALNNNNNINNSNSPSSNNISSSTIVPIVSIIPRIQTKDSTNSSQPITTSSISSSSQSTKPTIKTYEQREIEYRLARLRIMGEEESSVKDDDDLPVTESTSVLTDDNTKPTTTSFSSSSSTSSVTRTTNKMNGLSQQPLQCHSTPGSYASNLYTLNNVPTNTGTIHFTPNNNNSTPSLGTGPFSSPNIPQNYRAAYPVPYSHMPLSTGAPRYPLTATTTTTLYMTSTAPFVSAPSSSSSVSSSYHYPPQQHSNMTASNWYNYQHSQASSGAQQFGHPQ